MQSTKGLTEIRKWCSSSAAEHTLTRIDERAPVTRLPPKPKPEARGAQEVPPFLVIVCSVIRSAGGRAKTECGSLLQKEKRIMRKIS